MPVAYLHHPLQLCISLTLLLNGSSPPAAPTLSTLCTLLQEAPADSATVQGPPPKHRRLAAASLGFGSPVTAGASSCASQSEEEDGEEAVSRLQPAAQGAVAAAQPSPLAAAAEREHAEVGCTGGGARLQQRIHHLQ